MCYASLPAVMTRELRGEDVRMIRMRDEDEDDLIEWVLGGNREEQRRSGDLSKLAVEQPIWRQSDHALE